MMKNQDAKTIQMDRMRFTKNTLSANLVLLSIVADALYFVSLYQSDVGSYYYNILIGASVVYNLVFMLAAFLCSEGVKSRKGNYLPMLLALGIGQIVRMFIIPAQASQATVVINKVENAVMSNGQYTYMIVMLGISAACCIVAGVTSFIQNKKLNDYLKTL